MSLALPSAHIHSQVIIIPGGFGRSEYLLERLQERFAGIDIQGQHTPAVGEYQPVSRGAHLRYNDIADHGMPANESFGIAQVETYDPDVHDVADRTFIKIDPFSGEKIVYEGWCPILEYVSLCSVPASSRSNRCAGSTQDTWQVIPNRDMAAIRRARGRYRDQPTSLLDTQETTAA